MTWPPVAKVDLVEFCATVADMDIDLTSREVCRVRNVLGMPPPIFYNNPYRL
jgi:hypothetical protein